MSVITCTSGAYWYHMISIKIYLLRSLLKYFWSISVTTNRISMNSLEMICHTATLFVTGSAKCTSSSCLHLTYTKSDLFPHWRPLFTKIFSFNSLSPWVMCLLVQTRTSLGICTIWASAISYRFFDFHYEYFSRLFWRYWWWLPFSYSLLLYLSYFYSRIQHVARFIVVQHYYILFRIQGEF